MKRSGPIPRRTPLTRTKRRRPPSGKPKRFAARRDDPDRVYGDYIRSLPCLLASTGTCYGAVEADHAKTKGSGGMDLGNLSPLCCLHHAQRHTMGRHSFERKYHLNLQQIAAELFAHYDRWGA